MNKSELESKHLAELHSLAADAGIAGYRMLRREELIEKLADGGEPAQGQREPRGEPRQRPERKRRERQRRAPRDRPAKPAEAEEPAATEPTPPTPPPPTSSEPVVAAPERPKRRRRRFRRKGRKGVRVHDLLLPATPGRQAIVYAETREGCTALLRSVAGELSGASKGPDPVALLIDPSPEELADWKREAPQAEIVSAGQARHADDALALAARRAQGGEDVIVLIDSLSRFAETFGGADEAKDLFEAGRSLSGNGSLTVVAAVEKQ